MESFRFLFLESEKSIWDSTSSCYNIVYVTNFATFLPFFSNEEYSHDEIEFNTRKRRFPIKLVGNLV